jgi:hypothetical protein
LEDKFCGAAQVEIDPDVGCMTYSQVDEPEVAVEDEKELVEELLEDDEEEDEDLYGDEDDEDDDWEDDDDDEKESDSDYVGPKKRRR